MPSPISQRLFVLSPCGTSLLTNAAAAEQRTLVSRYANEPGVAAIPASDRPVLEGLIRQVRDTLLAEGTDLAMATQMSAEINGIVKLYGEQFQPKRGDCHYLLSTDTWLGQETAALIADWLKKQGCPETYVYRQTDLQTRDMQAFQSALSDLIEWCETTVDGYRQQGFRVIFNLTGGMKLTPPAGARWGCPC